VEAAFGRSAPFSIGIEEEFQLLSAESLELVPRFDEIAEAAEDDRVRQELMTSVMEAATGIAGSVPEAVEEVRAIRTRLAAAAAETGSVIASAGTHPFSRWEHQEITESPRYQGVAEELRWVAERVAIFGLHVHVGLDDADKAVAVATALRTWVPELLALSANSPFWHGRETGLASTRTQIFEAMPRSGLPPRLDTFAQFEALVDRAVAAGFFDDYTYLWWDVRPHPKLGTVELRACDAQTRIQSVAALAALVQSLAATLAARYEREGRLPAQPRTLLAENKWRAARYGLDATLVDLERDTERTAREAALELAELAGPAAQRLGCAGQLAELERICEQGGGAGEQRRIHEQEGTLLAVVQWLVATTAGD
jgi:carboxylate-amine ligase